MNGKIKTKFAALFAVALMITVCFTPTVSLFTEYDYSEAADEESVSISVFDKNGTALAGVSFGTGITGTTGQDGKLTLTLNDAKGKTLTPSLNGFTFLPSLVTIADDIQNNTEIKFTAYEDSVKVTFTSANNVVIDGLTVKYGDAADNLTGSITAVGNVATIPMSGEAVYIEPNSSDYTFAGDSETEGIYKITGATTIRANESVVTVEAQDIDGEALGAGSFSYSDDPAALNESVSTIDGKANIIFDFTDGKKLYVRPVFSGFKFINSNAQGDDKSVYEVTVNGATFESVNKKIIIEFSADVVGMYNVSLLSLPYASFTYKYKDATGTEVTGGTFTSNTSIPSDGKFQIAVEEGGKDLEISINWVKDGLGNEFGFPGNGEPAVPMKYKFENLSNQKIKSSDSVIGVTAKAVYADGVTIIDSEIEVIMSKGSQVGLKFDGANGVYTQFYKKDTTGSLTLNDGGNRYTFNIAEVQFGNPLETSVSYNFIANQDAEIEVTAEVVNSLNKNIGSPSVSLKIGDEVGTYDSTTGRYKFSIPRYTGNLEVSFGKYNLKDQYMYNSDIKDESNTQTYIVTDVTVSGLVYGKHTGEDVNRPFMNVGNDLTVSYANKTINFTTAINGEYTFNIPYGEAYSVKYDEASGNVKYWLASGAAIGNVENVVVRDIELKPIEFTTTGKIGAQELVSKNFADIVSEVTYSLNDGQGVSAYVRNGIFGIEGADPNTGLTYKIKIVNVSLKNGLSGFTFDNTLEYEIEDGVAETVYANQYVYSADAKSANGAALNGVTLTFTDVISGTAGSNITSTVADGKYVIPVAKNAKTLYKVSSDSYTFDEYFRIMIDVAANQKVTSGKLSTSIGGQYIPTANSGNVTSLDYRFVGTLMDANKVAFGSKNVTLTVAYEGNVSNNPLITDVNGKYDSGFVPSVNNMGDAIVSVTASTTYKTDGVDWVWKIKNPDVALTSPSADLVTEYAEISVSSKEPVKSYYMPTPKQKGIIQSVIFAVNGQTVTTPDDDTFTIPAIPGKAVSYEFVWANEGDYTGEGSFDVIEGTTDYVITSKEATFTFKTNVGVNIVVSGKHVSCTAGQNATVLLDYVGNATYDVATSDTDKGAGRVAASGSALLASDVDKVQTISIRENVTTIVVKDADGNDKLSGITVYLYQTSGPDGGLIEMATSDANGEIQVDLPDNVGTFWAVNVPGSKYTIDNSAAAFDTGDNNYLEEVFAEESRVSLEIVNAYDIETPVAGAIVTVGGVSGVSAADGKVVFEAVAAGAGATIADYVIQTTDFVTEVPATDGKVYVWKYTVTGNAEYSDGSAAAGEVLEFKGSEYIVGDDGTFDIGVYEMNGYTFNSSTYGDVSGTSILVSNVDNVLNFVVEIKLILASVTGTVETNNYLPISGELLFTDENGRVWNAVADEDGKFTVQLPSNVQNYILTTADGKYTFNGYAGELVANEYRVTIYTYYDAEPLSDVTIYYGDWNGGNYGGQDNVIYKSKIQTVDGKAVFDGVSYGDVFKPAKGGFAFHDICNDEKCKGCLEINYGGEDEIFIGAVEALELYSIQLAAVGTLGDIIGFDIFEVEKGEVVTISLINKEITGEMGDLISVFMPVIKKVDVNTSGSLPSIQTEEFLYWILADNSHYEDAAFTFVVGEDDNFKPVKNTYSFTPVFAESGEITIGNADGSDEKSIDSSVLILGIVVIVIAVLAVVLVVIRQFFDRNEDSEEEA